MKSTKTKRTGVIIAGYPNHLSEPTRRFLRGLLVLMLALGSLIALSAQGQSNYTGAYYFTTFAGAAIGADGTGKLALFNNPNSTAMDGAGNVYVADFNHHTVRKITPAGVVTTLAGLAGEGAVGDRDGTGVDARLYYPTGIALDSAGNIYVTEQYGMTIRKITPASVVSTLAGTFGVSGSANGTGSAASFFYPWGIAVDSGGNVYVSEILNHTIRKITPAGVVTTIAGAVEVTGSTDGSGSAARFNYPSGMALDSAGNLYVADHANSTVRKIVLSPSVSVTTFAGTAGVIGSKNGTGAAASFNGPYGLSVDGAGNVYVADSGNDEIRKITSSRVVSTFAGSVNNPPGGVGYVDGTGRAARFGNPIGIGLAGTTIYVADANHTIRKITSAGVV